VRSGNLEFVNMNSAVSWGSDCLHLAALLLAFRRNFLPLSSWFTFSNLPQFIYECKDILLHNRSWYFSTDHSEVIKST